MKGKLGNKRILLMFIVFLSMFLLQGCNGNGGGENNGQSSYCGDGVCNNDEDCLRCEKDCGQCPLPVIYKIYGGNFSPYMDGQDPNRGTQISEEQIRQRLRLIKYHTRWIRTFGSTSGLEKVCQVASEVEFDFEGIYLGAWLDKNLTTNEEEINNLIAAVKNCSMQNIRVIIGSEALLRRDLTATKLIEYINQVKTELQGTEVTTADIYSFFVDNPEVIDAVDFVFINFYPYWEGIDVKYVVPTLHIYYKKTVEAAEGKEVIVSETGWPSCGNTIGEAIPTPENAAFHFLNFVSWARAENVKYFYFELLDESWKALYEGPQGACWGIFNKIGVMKTGMQDVFDDKTMDDNWTCSDIIGGPGTPSIEFTYVPPYGSFENLKGQAWHVPPQDYAVTVYIKVGDGWWGPKPYWNNPKTVIQCDGAWTTDITTGGVDQTATEIVAYLIPVTYNPPTRSGHSWLPQELDDNSIAKTSVTRL